MEKIGPECQSQAQTGEQASNIPIDFQRLEDVPIRLAENELTQETGAGAGAAAAARSRAETSTNDAQAATGGKPPRNPRKMKANSSANAPKTPKEKTSEYWQYFTPLTVMIDGDPPIEKKKSKCNACGTLIAADPAIHGTSGMKNHWDMCVLKQEAKKKSGGSQTVLNLQESVDGLAGAGGTLTIWKFDQLSCRIALVEMIIFDELPFRFVEREGFKKFVERLCPRFKIPGRHTIRADCVKLFLERKMTMKSFFQRKDIGKVSITTDCWTAINNTNFICVTCHFIDKDWTLHKKIISFRKICSHKGNDLGESIMSSLEEWGLKKLMCCTMDNASANDVCIRYMKPVLERWNTSIATGKFLHVRCVAHILNLVVNDGLEEIGMSVRRVREAVKWIDLTPARTQAFRNTANALQIDCSKFLCFDVPTRWNSTYLMLEAALPYKEAFKFFGRMQDGFATDLNQKTYKDEPLGIPEEDDWLNVERVMDYLGKFFDVTLFVSGTTYATSHQFFMQMCDIFELISDMEMEEDVEVREMAKKMKLKLGKYWLETSELNPKMNKILYVAALLDPRQKMKHIEKCLKTVYGAQRAAQLVGEVKNAMYELFEIYKNDMTPPTTAPRVNATSSNSMRMGRKDRRGRGVGSCLLVASDEEIESSDNSEITLYFTEKQYVVGLEEAATWDILNWWMKNGPRFPVLAEMARDILAIPISSVASEAAFSTGGRVLSQFRSSLTPSMVEALICAEDWLRSSPIDVFLKDEENVPHTELEKEFDSVLKNLGFGGEIQGRSRMTESGDGSISTQTTSQTSESESVV